MCSLKFVYICMYVCIYLRNQFTYLCIYLFKGSFIYLSRYMYAYMQNRCVYEYAQVYTHISQLSRVTLSSQLLFSWIQDITLHPLTKWKLAGKVKAEGGRCGERAVCFGFGSYELESESHGWCWCYLQRYGNDAPGGDWATGLVFKLPASNMGASPPRRSR